MKEDLMVRRLATREVVQNRAGVLRGCVRTWCVRRCNDCKVFNGLQFKERFKLNENNTTANNTNNVKLINVCENETKNLKKKKKEKLIAEISARGVDLPISATAVSTPISIRRRRVRPHVP
jgi:hypothetical protein